MFSEFEAILKKTDPGPAIEPKLEEVIESKCWIVKNLLTTNESRAFIEAGRRLLDFTYIANGYRHCYRAKFDDPELLSWLWERVVPLIPNSFPHKQEYEDSSDSDEDEKKQSIIIENKIWVKAGLYQYPRFCYYDSDDQHFTIHYDYPVTTSKRDRSFLTFMLYLNGPPDYEGGNTNFFGEDSEITYSLQPESGLAIFFLQGADNKLPHEGAPVTSGVKYIFRTEVMYKLIDKT